MVCAKIQIAVFKRRSHFERYLRDIHSKSVFPEISSVCMCACVCLQMSSTSIAFIYCTIIFAIFIETNSQIYFYHEHNILRTNENIRNEKSRVTNECLLVEGREKEGGS